MLKSDITSVTYIIWAKKSKETKNNDNDVAVVAVAVVVVAVVVVVVVVVVYRWSTNTINFKNFIRKITFLR